MPRWYRRKGKCRPEAETRNNKDCHLNLSSAPGTLCEGVCLAQPLPSIDDVQIRLTGRCRKQQGFAAGYSPLYSRLFGLLADWLAAAEQGSDPLVDWLLQAAASRSSFDVPLLLLAGLHRDILTGVAEVADLAQYYPTAGGARAVDDSDLGLALREAILARQSILAEFLRTATVQTNEAARGLCWLLPVLFTGWPSIHLADLGASAGLNLVADYRNYRLVEGEKGRVLLDLGSGDPGQFFVASQGACSLPPQSCTLPAILSRIGCDCAPFQLTTKRDEQTLAAFIWGDQPGRLALLRQGIAAFHRVNSSQVPVRLHPVDLPDELARFLEQQVPTGSDAPTVIFNTYLTTYLHDKGASLWPQLAAWAGKQAQPVLWLQWETLWQGPRSPEFGWVGWTADLWRDGRHFHWQLGWAHPHGAVVQWLPESADWADFWRVRPRNSG